MAHSRISTQASYRSGQSLLPFITPAQRKTQNQGDHVAHIVASIDQKPVVKARKERERESEREIEILHMYVYINTVNASKYTSMCTHVYIYIYVCVSLSLSVLCVCLSLYIYVYIYSFREVCFHFCGRNELRRTQCGRALLRRLWMVLPAREPSIPGAPGTGFGSQPCGDSSKKSRTYLGLFGAPKKTICFTERLLSLRPCGQELRMIP